MKKALLASALIAALGTTASAQGIAPVQTATGETDAVLSSAGPAIGLTPGLIAAGIVITGVIIAVADGESTDGT